MIEIPEDWVETIQAGGTWTPHAVTPKVIIKDDATPREHEIYNCTTCKRGKIIKEYPPDPDRYVARCGWDGKMHIGENIRWNNLVSVDIGCRWFIPSKPRPRKGYMPGVES